MIEQSFGAKSYTTEVKRTPSDHEMSEWMRKSRIRRLSRELGMTDDEELRLPQPGGGDITIGNSVLSRHFARNYLSYLKGGGKMDMEGYYQYRYNKRNFESMINQLKGED